jgi:hypothetical protein
MPDDEDLISHSVLFKNDLFPSKTRPEYFDFFTLLHYPNQLMKSLRSRKTSWDRRTEDDTYEIQFLINDVEIFKRRDKKNQPCHQNGNDYDNAVLMKHSEAVGCRAPYLKSYINTRMCSTKEEMKRAQFELRYDEYGNIPPCMTMDKISYTYKEIEHLNTQWENIGHFWTTIKIGNPKFKEIVQIR